MLRHVSLLAAASAVLADPNIWPLPKSYTSGATAVTISPSLVFHAPNPSDDLQKGFERYRDLIFTHSGAQAIGVRVATVTVANPKADLQLGVDESYTLSVTTAGINVTARTQFGAYYALETLSQLIVFDYDTASYVVEGAPWRIDDAPRFPHREVLIDTSRHFQPVASLKRIVQSLPYAKINTLHWHIVDKQSFPYIAPSYPKLAQLGAFSPQERYSQNDVADVIEFCRLRGVRVVLEVDTPGHAQSWCKGHPEVCPSSWCHSPLNPTTNATFDMIKGVFSDLARVSFENHMHIGGDEVDTLCWDIVPEIVEWLVKERMTTKHAYGYFSGRVSDILFAMGKSVTGWEELWNHFGTKLDKRTIIQQWLPRSHIVKEATAAGYRVIWSTDGVWYLDHLDTKWDTMYSAEPCAEINSAQCELVLGGGGEMWGETADPSDVEQTTWPRLAAVAERLWSPRNVTDTAKALPRLLYFRCLLNRRGVAAAPVKNAKARSAPPGPGSCYSQ